MNTEIKRDPAEVPALYILDPEKHKNWLNEALKEKIDTEYSLLEEIVKDYFGRDKIDAQFLINEEIRVHAVTHVSNPLGCFNYNIYHDGLLISRVYWEQGDHKHHFILKHEDKF